MAHAALLNLRGAEVQAQLGNVLQRPHRMHNYDHRPPVTIPGSHLSNAVVPSFANGDSCFRLGSSRDVHNGYGSRMAVHHATQQYRHSPALSHHQNGVSSDTSIAPANLLDAHVAERAAMMKMHALTNMNGNLAASLDVGQLALLQQQNQLQQLQLLTQMQKSGINPSIAVESHNFDQGYSLMPSADISTNNFIDSDTQISIENASTRERGHERAHGRKGSTSHAHRHSDQPYRKSSLSELPSSAQMLLPNPDHYHGQHNASDPLSIQQLQQQKQQAAENFTSVSENSESDINDADICL